MRFAWCLDSRDASVILDGVAMTDLTLDTRTWIALNAESCTPTPHLLERALSEPCQDHRESEEE
jgi:hypothetical protein